ncbi:MAG: lytic transglycosylase domain-containing protein [Bdellovibrionales bacterium]|nr:lytic transglycosylase domain-containing protein [Bdellovibrionales bacterium]
MSKKSKKPKSKLKISPYAFICFTVVIYFLMILVVQIIQKPAHLLGFMSSYFYKTPYETWQSYHQDFKQYETITTSSYVLAAIAQVESSGNPIATPHWEWNLKNKWHSLYAPVSSSVGLYQFTTPTFERAGTLCVHKGEIYDKVEPYQILHPCWWSRFGVRLSASSSIRAASAYLHKEVGELLRRFNMEHLGVKSRARLAMVVHLCGKYKAALLLKKRSLASLGYCGSHNVAQYIKKAERLIVKFKKLDHQKI